MTANLRIEQLKADLCRLPQVSKVEVDQLSSGVVFVTTWFGDRCFGLYYHPREGSAVYDVAEQNFDAGPKEYFEQLGDAADRLLVVVQNPAKLSTAEALVG